MKLLSFGPVGMERPGLLLEGDRVLDLLLALDKTHRSLRELLNAGLLDHLDKIVNPDPAHIQPLKDLRISAPITNPSKILCLGLNYKDHAKEQNKPLPTSPLIFPKVPSAVIGPDASVVLPDPEIEDFIDPEAELAIVIGRRGYKIPIESAVGHIAGYTIMNDVSGRDTQKAEKQWLRAKGFDTFAPMGPWIVTKDEVPDPHSLEITCKVNSELRQKSNTSNLIFKTDFLVSYLSQTMTLEAGDVISTGTPGGVGIFRDPPVKLQDGDLVEIEISSIGMLRNKIKRG